MKRDMELVRKILLALEMKTGQGPYINVDGYNTETVGYHCAMMYEYGLIENFRKLQVQVGHPR